VTQRLANVIYSLNTTGSGTIKDTSFLGQSQVVDYGPGDFFPFYQIAFDPTSATGFITALAEQLAVVDQYDALLLLQQLIAVPVAAFNNPPVRGIHSPEDEDVTGVYVKSGYQVPNLMLPD